VIAYIDSSVVLRLVLNQPGQLAEWKKIVTAVTCGLLEVECLRTLDRLKVLGHITAEDVARRRETVYRFLEAMEIVDLSASVLRRAGQSISVPLGSLDAIHLASAEAWREARGMEPVIATHDRQLGLAARASGFRITGL